jgi:GT2 family glycosyltransferase
MKPYFSLIICTYMRPKALCDLLQSVSEQTLYPNEILIIDGSTNHKTKVELELHHFKNLHYFLVDATERGLTRQRNFGIHKVNPKSEVVCFLDDDTILESHYFEELISTYTKHPDALGVGGYITNEVAWKQSDKANNPNNFYYDGFMRSEPSRFKIRRKFGLEPDTPPGFLPSFSHGRSISFLPPSEKIYEVEQLMGGVSSFKKKVFKYQQFSTYFDGYGLYEDADFTLRLSKKGKLFVNTNAKLAHYHDVSGRPNQFKYGKMVLRNGWYVWRVKYSNPSLKARFKWHATALLLTLIRATNILTSAQKKEALTETLGRISGWFSIFTNKPK